MAGSMKTVVYTGDDGTQWCIKVDESNVEMIMGAQVPANGSFPAPPKQTEPRFVRVEDVTGKIRRTIPVLTLARYTALNGATALTLGGQDADSGTAVRVRNKRGEVIGFIPRDYDTGKVDGDAD